MNMRQLTKQLNQVGVNLAVITSVVASAGQSACFTAGTQIVVGIDFVGECTCHTTDEWKHTSDCDVFVQYVTVNIEDIKVGDYVYSYDTLTGEYSYKEVTETVVLTSNHLNYLTIEDENGNIQTIETTDSHPFGVVTDNPDLERAARSVVDENGVML